MADEAVLEQPTSTEAAAPVESQASAPVSSTPSKTASAIDAMASGGGEETAHLPDSGTAQPSFFEQLAEFGEEFKGITDPVAAQTRLLEHARELRQKQQQLADWQQRAQPYVQYGQQYAQLARDPEYQAWLANKQAAKQQPAQNQPVQAAPPAQQPQKWWNPPAFDRNSITNYIEHVVDPASGEVVPRFKADTPVDVRTAYAEHQKYLNEWADGLATRPHEVIPQIIQQEVGPLIEQALAQRDQAMQAQQFVSNVMEQNASWLVQHDQSGAPILDPVSRQPVLTEAGAKVANHMKWLEQGGMNDRNQRWYVALTMLQNEALQQSQAQQTAQQSVEQVAAAKKAEALGRGANHIPDRSGSNPRPQSSKQVPQNRRLTAGQRMAAAMTRDGLDSISPAELFGAGV